MFQEEVSNPSVIKNGWHSILVGRDFDWHLKAKNCSGREHEAASPVVVGKSVLKDQASCYLKLFLSKFVTGKFEIEADCHPNEVQQKWHHSSGDERSPFVWKPSCNLEFISQSGVLSRYPGDCHPYSIRAFSEVCKRKARNVSVQNISAHRVLAFHIGWGKWTVKQRFSDSLSGKNWQPVTSFWLCDLWNPLLHRPGCIVIKSVLVKKSCHYPIQVVLRYV